MGKKAAEEYRGWTEEDVRQAGEGVVGDAPGGERPGRMTRARISRGKVAAAGVGAEDGAGTDMDRKVRLRVAEILSSAGVDEKRVALEVLYLMPGEFLRAYEDLFHRALTTGEEGNGTANDRQAELGRASGKGSGKISSSGGGEMRAARRGKGGRRGPFIVREDAALAEKDALDRTLRKLARRLRDQGAAGTGKETVAKCGEREGRDAGSEKIALSEGVGADAGAAGEDLEGKGCGRWVEKGWNFCPTCGRAQK